jgi:hypothetical protein
VINLPSYDDEDDEDNELDGDGTRNVKDLRKMPIVRHDATMTPLLEIKAIM